MSALKVGITGGIGSGKTTVCKIFETLGIPVYYADDRAKALMVENKDLIVRIKHIFGDNAYTPEGELNRSYISQVAFTNPEKLKELNAAVHPAVLEDGIIWHESQKDTPYTLKEAALLFESGSYIALDKIITVTAPEDVRIERVMKRNNLSREEVEARIAKQMPESEKVQRSDFVINNDGEHALIPQVLEIHAKFLKSINYK